MAPPPFTKSRAGQVRAGPGKEKRAEEAKEPVFHIQTAPAAPTRQLPDWTVRNAEPGSRLKKWNCESQAGSRELTSQDRDGLEKSQDQAYV